MDTLTGTLLCTWLALTLTLVGQNTSHSLELLALFVPGVAVIARVWGFVAAMLGTASACAVFCTGMFAPTGRMQVASADARTGLFWMVLCAGVAAHIFARPRCIRTELREGGKSC
jgi:K+-sensing histidine kinase KdpD